MSASPIARQACSINIPSKRVFITDASQLPDIYSSTPGGTLYSTTPGGTRIVYERAFLMNLKNSPTSRSPPKNIPQNLIRVENNNSTPNNNNNNKKPSNNHHFHHHHHQHKPSPLSRNTPPKDLDQDQFDMDI